MFRVQCRTNLDDVGREDWPTLLPAVPRVGDRIESGTVWKSNNTGQSGVRVTLEVSSITWKKCNTAYSENKGEWYPEIELHLPKNNMFRHIQHFQDWYAHIQGRMDHDLYVERCRRYDWR